MAQRFHERQAFDATTAPLPQPIRIECDHYRGPMILSRQPRCDNPENARMPVTRAKDDGRIARGIERLRQFFLCLAANFSLDCLAFTILRVEKGCQFRCFGFIASEQKTQRFLRGGQPSGGIESRAESEGDILGRDGRTDRSYLHEPANAWPLRPRDFTNAALNEDSV